MTPWNVFDIAAVLVVLAAALGVVNHRFLRLPFTIGLTVAGLGASLLVVVVDAFLPGLHLREEVHSFLLRDVDFNEALMHGMLSFLLFAGALHVNLDDLLEQRTPILTLASVGVLLSTAVVGLGSWGAFAAVGVDVPLTACLVFGALISPTDPIAVIGILKTAGVPRSLEMKVAGESLFNDGVGVVVFSLLLAAAVPGSGHGSGVAVVFLREVVGGVALGLVGGWAAYRAMATMEEPNLEVLISVALVMGVTLAGFRLHTSAPLACVVAGLFIGNRGRRFAMGEETRNALDIVWSFLDEAMNAVLFLLIGLEVFALTFRGAHVAAALLAIPLSLLARFVAVGVPVRLLAMRRTFSPGAVRVLTWGGLRGGISVALAMSLPPAVPGREAILFVTYAVVLFSLLVQGLTVGRVVRAVTAEGGSAPSAGPAP